MLDLQPIKDRLASATPGPWNDAKSQLILNAPTDLAALVAEVERLREAIGTACKAWGTKCNLDALEIHELWAALEEAADA